jgi:hypothetical protein
MRNLMCIFLLILIVFNPIDTEAQLLRRLKTAAEEGVARAVEKRVVSEVEKATQKQFEKAFGDLYSGPKGSKTYDFNKILESINMDVDTEESYSFIGMAEMEVNSTDSKGNSEDPVHITSYLSKNDQYTGMEFSAESSKKSKEKTVMIFDFKNNATIMLVENEEGKSSMAFGLDWQKMIEGVDDMSLEEDADEPVDFEDFKFEKTGNTKTILGFSCEEYMAKNEEVEAFYWISTSPIEGLETFLGRNSSFISHRTQSHNQQYFNNLPEGSMMEMNVVSQKDKSSSSFTMTSIDVDAKNTFIMEAYPNVMKNK